MYFYILKFPITIVLLFPWTLNNLVQIKQHSNILLFFLISSPNTHVTTPYRLIADADFTWRFETPEQHCRPAGLSRKNIRTRYIKPSIFSRIVCWKKYNTQLLTSCQLLAEYREKKIKGKICQLHSPYAFQREINRYTDRSHSTVELKLFFHHQDGYRIKAVMSLCNVMWFLHHQL